MPISIQQLTELRTAIWMRCLRHAALKNEAFEKIRRHRSSACVCRLFARDEQPRLFFMCSRAYDDAKKCIRGLGAALEDTNVKHP
jgi:hypothetical protein